MKRVKRSLLALVLVFCMALSILPAPAFAGEAVIGEPQYLGEGLQWTLFADGRLVIEKRPDYDGTEFNMPDYYDTKSTPWYSFRNSIKSVEIKSPVTSVGANTFSGCPNLTDVTIGSTIAEIGFGAFFRCEALTTAEILGSVKTIGAKAFYSCSALEILEINAETIGSEAFYGCSALETVTITTSKLWQIADGAFSNCTKLSKLTIPDSVVMIGERVLSQCKALKTIDFPGNERYVVEDSCLFDLKYGVKDVLLATAPQSIPDSYTVPDTVKRIGDGAFAQCLSLKTVILPDGLETIGNCAFSECPSLKTLTLPDGLKTIGAGTFENCSQLSELVIPDSVYSIGSQSFKHCTFDITIPGRIWKIPGELFLSADTKHITLSEGCQSISAYAVSDCPNLESISLPSTLEQIKYDAVFRCPNLNIINYEGTAADWREISIDMGNLGLFDTNIKFYCKNEIAHRLIYGPGKSGVTFTYTTLFDALDKNVNVIEAELTGPIGGKFKGWLIDGKLYQPGEPYPVEGVTEDITATAIWFDQDIPGAVLNKVTLDYQYNGKKEEITLSDNSLPTPTRDGYRFDGWYTETSGGDKITGTTVSKLADGTTLYAHWTKIFTVTFDANGGTVSVTTLTVTNDSSYGKLPVPVRKGYDFDGWYTEMEDGKQITETTTVKLDGDQTLYAHWTEKEPEITYKITFNANGGEVKVTDKIVTKGKTYGTLPVPVREGLLFGGWYTAEVDGNLISETTTVDLDGDQTLYAHWVEDYLSKLSFSFTNSRLAFRYNEGYCIPYARFQMVYGDDSALAKTTYEHTSAWRGNCSGIATAASLFYIPDNGVNFTDFVSGPNAEPPMAISELTPDYRNKDWDLSLRAFIEALQISQFSYNDASHSNGKTLKELWDEVESCENGGEPVYIRTSGHALIGYRTETVSDTEGRIYVYDCNYPLDRGRYITLRKTSPNGEYTSGSYQNYRSFDPYSIEVPSWLSSRTRTSMINPKAELLFVNSDSAEIRDSSGDLAAKIDGGEITAIQSGVYPVKAVEDVAPGNDFDLPENPFHMIWLPVGQYTVVNQDKTIQQLEATMVHVEQAATVRTSGNTVSFIVDDNFAADDASSVIPVSSVQLAEPGVNYEVCLENSAGTEGYTELLMTGTTSSEAVSFAQIGNHLYMDGVPLEEPEYAKRINGNVYFDADLDDENFDYAVYEQKKEEFEPISWTQLSEEEVTAEVTHEIPYSLWESDTSDETSGGGTSDKPEIPDNPSTPDNSENLETPDNTGTSENPEIPDNTGTPENPENPDNTSTPENPENPDNTSTPENPENPDNTSTPENPENPDNTNTPENPENPDNTSTPENPEIPDNTGTPENPENPDNTSTPENPENPETPEEPAGPETPITESSSYSVNVFYSLGRGEWRSNSAYHPSNITVYSGKSTSFTPSTPIRSDFYFLGWTYDGQRTPVKTVTVPANYGDTLYLTANWEYEDYSDYDDGDYRVRVRSSSHGRVTANLDYAGYGDIVTLTVKPDSGYELQELTVTNDNRDREVSVTERGGASYRFTMPSSSVTVEAVFQQTAVSSGTDTRTAGTPDTSAPPVIVPISPSTPAVSGTVAAAIYYADVRPRDWYYSSVQYLSQRNLMKGTSASVFSPSGTTTHAMIWTMLARLNGQNTGGGSSWYQSSLDWCRANGILDGIPNSSNPNSAVAREELAVMLWHSKGSPVPAASLGQFTDSSRVSTYAQNALRWAVEQGIIKGSGGALNPQGLATRAETAQIFMNFISVTGA